MSTTEQKLVKVYPDDHQWLKIQGAERTLSAAEIVKELIDREKERVAAESIVSIKV